MKATEILGKEGTGLFESINKVWCLKAWAPESTSLV